MKNRLFLLLCLLWLCNYTLGAVKPGFDRAYLYIKVPSNINLQKYEYRLNAKFVNKHGVFFDYSPKIKEPGQIIRCEIREGYKQKYEDTLVDIIFSVHGKKWYDQYVHHQVRLHINADSLFYAIPDLPGEDVVDSILHKEGKVYRREVRREDFKDFMTDWKSYFIYANFYQGNRPYGEVSFSNARYNEIEIGNPFSRYRSSEPGFIRGPVYGAEFNFLWRKNAFILGPKIGFQLAARHVNLGLSGVYYTDFTHGLFCIKPRIGINPGVPWVNFSYEYAIRCGYNYFGNRINRHQFSVYFLIPLRLKETGSFF